MLWPARKSLCMTKNSAVPSACAACLQAPPCTWGVARKLLPELNPAVLPTSRGPIGTNSSGAITVDRPSHLFSRPFFGQCFGSNWPYPRILAVEFTMFQSVEKNRLFSHILFDVDDTFRFRRLAPHVSLARWQFPQSGPSLPGHHVTLDDQQLLWRNLPLQREGLFADLVNGHVRHQPGGDKGARCPRS